MSEEIGQTRSDELFVMLLGDMNGHAGVGADRYDGVHGGYAYGMKKGVWC